MAGVSTKVKYRGTFGKYISKEEYDRLIKEKEADPPFFQLKVTNPITYIKNWWKKIIANEGVDIRIRVKPLTTVILILAILAGSYGLGFVTSLFAQVPYLRDILPSPTPVVTPTPTPNPWKETAYTGTLRFTTLNSRYYLTTTSSEAITLEVPPQIDLAKLVGKKILAVGNYNKITNVMQVMDVSNLTILPAGTSQPIPTVSPQPNL